MHKIKNLIRRLLFTPVIGHLVRYVKGIVFLGRNDRLLAEVILHSRETQKALVEIRLLHESTRQKIQMLELLSRQDQDKHSALYELVHIDHHRFLNQLEVDDLRIKELQQICANLQDTRTMEKYAQSWHQP